MYGLDTIVTILATKFTEIPPLNDIWSYFSLFPEIFFNGFLTQIRNPLNFNQSRIKGFFDKKILALN